MIEVVNFSDLRTIHDDDGVVVTTVSKSPDWNGLSPFLIGPCQMWGGRQSRNMENAWQYSKVYQEHLEEDGSVGPKWLAWATGGWYSQRANRYPMGKDARPLFSWWEGRKLTYVEARKAIYIPLYALTVRQTDAWRRLADVAMVAGHQGKNLYLVDFDAYRHKGMGRSYNDVVNDPARKMGHAFVLAMMLEAPETMDEILAEGMALRTGGKP